MSSKGNQTFKFLNIQKTTSRNYLIQRNKENLMVFLIEGNHQQSFQTQSRAVWCLRNERSKKYFLSSKTWYLMTLCLTMSEKKILLRNIFETKRSFMSRSIRLSINLILNMTLKILNVQRKTRSQTLSVQDKNFLIRNMRKIHKWKSMCLKMPIVIRLKEV